MEEDDYRALVLRDEWGMASYLYDDGTEEE